MVFSVPSRRELVFLMAKVQAQSVTQVLPVWWNWEVVRMDGVGTRGMGKRGGRKAEAKKDMLI